MMLRLSATSAYWERFPSFTHLLQHTHTHTLKHVHTSPLLTRKRSTCLDTHAHERHNQDCTRLFHAMKFPTSPQWEDFNSQEYPDASPLQPVRDVELKCTGKECASLIQYHMVDSFYTLLAL